jgi:hypothetical protein
MARKILLRPALFQLLILLSPSFVFLSGSQQEGAFWGHGLEKLRRTPQQRSENGLAWQIISCTFVTRDYLPEDEAATMGAVAPGERTRETWVPRALPALLWAQGSQSFGMQDRAGADSLTP